LEDSNVREQRIKFDYQADIGTVSVTARCYMPRVTKVDDYAVCELEEVTANIGGAVLNVTLAISRDFADELREAAWELYESEDDLRAQAAEARWESEREEALLHG
jgi:hypothetical protein